MIMIIFIIVAILVIGALGAAEWNAYRKRSAANAQQEPAARRRLRRRALGLFLLLIELFLLVFYNAFQARMSTPWPSLIYLGVCLALAVVIFWVVVVDVRASLTEIIKSQADISDHHVEQLEKEIQQILNEQDAGHSDPLSNKSKKQ